MRESSYSTSLYQLHTQFLNVSYGCYLTNKPVRCQNVVQLSIAQNVDQAWVKRIENRSHGNAIAEVNLKQIKAKLAGLLEEEESKADTSRRNCRITGFKFA